MSSPFAVENTGKFTLDNVEFFCYLSEIRYQSKSIDLPGQPLPVKPLLH